MSDLRLIEGGKVTKERQFTQDACESFLIATQIAQNRAQQLHEEKMKIIKESFFMQLLAFVYGACFGLVLATIMIRVFWE
jgi:hypothetical protein